ncbi:hydrogenase expression/formation protein HypE [Microbulbifer hydrolyticus]|uniref:Hydrogenase expression/formation protein HypE n=1 Tax=Microbulbifer hydrolyticus TaxID=48074 RepID=A0A6P1T8I5_9GAMM|nr:hydrogenase expression/formation protein HypE [Microbulbifer hydrolyticus]MBB5210418.1 hydrogenase expression/formation protein HypE [Microbulbifer hydrolyticus]QHQ39098.1 hydrogenase expression/formation protein HypE [Microbulbifer hydrolyticus]
MNIECPIPVETDELVRLGHGSGGELSQQLLQKHIFPYFNNPWVAEGRDSSVLPLGDQQLVFTTDSYVVTPLFFPGGDIGKLAVYGTVNDLAMSGARPLYLSCSLILEEGLPMETLDRVMASMGEAAAEVGVALVTGDTKVVERGKGDGLYINTSGIGMLEQPLQIGPGQIQPGDRILLSGDIGRHGMTIMATREGLEFESPLQSDCAPLHGAVAKLLNAGIVVHCLRDLTRGGLATVLVELAESSGYQLLAREDDIPVCTPVQGACEILGLDPLYVANEGRFIAFVPEQDAARAQSILCGCPVSEGCQVIGEVRNVARPQAVLENALGYERLLDRLPGEQLPRIC